MDIQPPDDKYEKRFKHLLKTKSYFKLIEKCKSRKYFNICNNPVFWKKKLRKEYPYELNHEYEGYKYKGIYEVRLSQDLLALSIDPDNFHPDEQNKLFKLYGNDKEKLKEKSAFLRHEGNKKFTNVPHVYSVTKFITDDPRGHLSLDERYKIDLGLPGQLFTIESPNMKYYAYKYQFGNEVRVSISKYPELPEMLYEDTPEEDIYKIYGIRPKLLSKLL